MSNISKMILGALALCVFVLCGMAAKNAAPARAVELSAWVVYWDQQTVPDELTALQGGLSAVSHFSAVFDKERHLSIPKQTSAFYRTAAEQLPPDTLHYLTIVNDIVYADGSSSLKNTAIMKTLLADTASRAAHIGEILDLAEQNGYDGVEIDYEKLHSRKGLAEQFALFCGELWQAAQQRGLRVRVVLEPSFPMDKISMPKGPDYVVMLYNLYGYGAATGPKADAAFIKEMAQKVKALPGDTVFAFATGGFDWPKDATAQALTEAQARQLAADTGAVVRYDKQSGGAYFSYTAKGGISHTVWFADGNTLKVWMDVAAQNGAQRFALWRLGGNEQDSLRMLIPEAPGGSSKHMQHRKVSK